MSYYDPLHPQDKTSPQQYGLDVEIAVTRQFLDETASLNIHDDNDMRTAAFTLNFRIRALLAAVEAERGEAR